MSVFFAVEKYFCMSPGTGRAQGLLKFIGADTTEQIATDSFLPCRVPQVFAEE
jgi:hypothetical protein